MIGGITREQALEIASAYLRDIAQRQPWRFNLETCWHLPVVSKVRAYGEGVRLPSLIRVRGAFPLQWCWIAYLDRSQRHRMSLCASEIVAVSRGTGEVVYFGSADDEG